MRADYPNRPYKIDEEDGRSRWQDSIYFKRYYMENKWKRFPYWTIQQFVREKSTFVNALKGGRNQFWRR